MTVSESKQKYTATAAVKELVKAIKATTEARGFAEYNHARVAEEAAWKKFRAYIAREVTA